MNIRMATYDGFDKELYPKGRKKSTMKNPSKMTLAEVSKEMADSYVYCEACVKNDPQKLAMLRDLYQEAVSLMVSFMMSAADFMTIHEMSLEDVDRVFDEMIKAEMMREEPHGNA